MDYYSPSKQALNAQDGDQRQQIKVYCAAMSDEVLKVVRAGSCAVLTNVNLMLYLLRGPLVVQRQQIY